MRVWHTKLTPILCRQHLLGAWHEIWAVWAMVTDDTKKGRGMPQVKEFIDAPYELYLRMYTLRAEMLKRNYHPKPLPERPSVGKGILREWQTLAQQLENLKTKRNATQAGTNQRGACYCKIEAIRLDK